MLEYIKTEYLEATYRMILSISNKYKINKKRIYGTGQSMGAMTNLYLLANSNIITDPEEIKCIHEEIQKADKQNQIEKNKKNKDFIPKSVDFVFKLVY